MDDIELLRAAQVEIGRHHLHENGMSDQPYFCSCTDPHKADGYRRGWRTREDWDEHVAYAVLSIVVPMIRTDMPAVPTPGSVQRSTV